MSEPVAVSVRRTRAGSRRYGPSSGNPATTDSSPGRGWPPRPERCRRQPVDREHRKVALGVEHDDLRRVLPADAGDLHRRLAHAGDDVGVGDDLARRDDPAAALLAARQATATPVTRTTDREACWTPGDAATPDSGGATGAIGSGRQATEHLRDAVLVQQRPEPGEQLARCRRHHPVDRREDPGLADRLGQRGRRGTADGPRDEPHQQRYGDDGGHARRRSRRGPARTGRVPAHAAGCRAGPRWPGPPSRRGRRGTPAPGPGSPRCW